MSTQKNNKPKNNSLEFGYIKAANQSILARHPQFPPKTISVFRRLPESLHALGRDPAIYVLIKHFFLPIFLVPFCGYKNLRNLWLIFLRAIRV